MEQRPELIVLAGPTGSGKTVCAVELCRQIDGEVISADSMQIYRGMDILSAKPTPEEMRGIPHHMIGFADPEIKYSAAAFREGAGAVVRDVIARGKHAVLCGGTGLYIDALTKPMRFSEKSDEALHAKLMAIAEEPGGRARLHAMLDKVDPDSARRLHPNDVRRVARAIEIFELTGITQTEQSRRDAEAKGDFNERLFALEWPMEILYERIDRRVDEMLERGLVEEVQALMRRSERFPTAQQAIGYKEIALALEGRIDMEEAVIEVKRASRNYAKRQMTWLRRDRRTEWIPAEGRNASEIVTEIRHKLNI